MGASLVPGNVPEEVEVHSGQPPTINYKLRDFDHKGLYLRDKILVAAHMQGPNMNQEGWCSSEFISHMGGAGGGGKEEATKVLPDSCDPELGNI